MRSTSGLPCDRGARRGPAAAGLTRSKQGCAERVKGFSLTSCAGSTTAGCTRGMSQCAASPSDRHSTRSMSVKLIRTGLVVAAVGALMTLPLAAAHAAPAPQTLEGHLLQRAGGQGWTIETPGSDEAHPTSSSPGTPHRSEREPAVRATDRVRFRPRRCSSAHRGDILAPDFVGSSFDYYFAPHSAGQGAALQFYLNLYVDTAAPTRTRLLRLPVRLRGDAVRPTALAHHGRRRGPLATAVTVAERRRLRDLHRRTAAQPTRSS